LLKQPSVFIDTSGIELETLELCKGRGTVRPFYKWANWNWVLRWWFTSYCVGI